VTGAEAALQVALEHGIEVCFANPGTTELPLVAALDRCPAIRPVLGLFEGVCTGGADGYARMAGKPALTLLHLGPGLANGLANLHNARRAGTPIVNLIGEHATWHVNADPPLASDIEALARTVSRWIRTTRTAGEIRRDMGEAIAAAVEGPGIATLILPSDCQAGEAPPMSRAGILPARAGRIPPVSDAAHTLRTANRAGLLLGGSGLNEPGLLAAARVAAATGCRLLCERVPARIERGAGLPAPERLLYFPEQLQAQLADIEILLLAGAREPVAFFGYPGTPSRPLSAEQRIEVLAAPGEDAAGALEALARELGAPAGGAGILPGRAGNTPAPLPEGPLTRDSLAACLAALELENAIIVDESVTQNRGGFLLPDGWRRHSYLSVTGGAIGFGMPCATGAAVACPDRPVLNVQADGSAMYTIQALWTQAREGLNVTTVLCSNRSYAILRGEMRRAGQTDPGPAAAQLTDLGRPDIDWVALARGLGVPGCRVSTAEDCLTALRRANAEPGPYLLQADL
jgi:acetolactate synthase-1/2/3 large subunit